MQRVNVSFERMYNVTISKKIRVSEGKEDTVSRDSLLSSEFESVETPTELADSRSTTPPTATQPLRLGFLSCLWQKVRAAGLFSSGKDPKDVGGYYSFIESPAPLAATPRRSNLVTYSTHPTTTSPESPTALAPPSK
ncbi:hypothetical protein EDD22DRAFT_852607 [Suillus occidentalis]|nr:hypothetical protein EDD22DRAFT_852607 [Suillus occidentalis]